MDLDILKNSPITFLILYLLKDGCQPIKLVLSINDSCSQKVFDLLDTRTISLVPQLSLHVPGKLNQTEILN